MGDICYSQFPLLKEEWKKEECQIELDQGIPTQLFYDSSEAKQLSKQYQCDICTDILWEPDECSVCKKNYCRKCIRSCIQVCENCPNCSQIFKSSKTHPIVYSTLCSSRFKCLFSKDYGCKEIVEYEKFLKHANNCLYRKQNRFDIKQIEIQNYKIVQEKYQKQYIRYQIQITYYCNESYIISKRYSEFAQLHQDLYSDQEILGKIIPHLPDKMFDFYSLVGYSPRNEQDIIYRKILLESYLNLLNQNPHFSKRDCFKQFLSKEGQSNEELQIGSESKINKFIENIKDVIKKNKDTTLQLLEQQMNTLTIRDINLDSKNLEENEQECKQFEKSVQEIFQLLAKTICQCNDAISQIAEKSNKSDDQEKDAIQNKKRSMMDTSEQIQADFNDIIQEEVKVIQEYNTKVYKLIMKIGLCLCRLKGFQDALVKLKEYIQKYISVLKQKFQCSEEKQKELLDNQINELKQIIEISQKNLDEDSNILKQDIISSIPDLVSEYHSLNQSYFVPSIQVYEDINNKNQPNNDKLFYQIQNLIFNNNN
ncbi:PX-domain protein (macronuclear) [Tetrahymena thermophila SB210]|uniref:PX-domain protein n=1 Tax=Tetrahymena thermophila (strain SB210) TaxID=312017 RepID=Q240W8_TETTS|nr:PX-domain protein [Tetrahymena thermophila SB210]EAS02296.2 PX-domain protein [Tetrahymena thermophila SB210]|eukprot:XP_001022541.2 PX-domain protein [Tetrahymena thermophila SB210]